MKGTLLVEVITFKTMSKFQLEGFFMKVYT